MAAAVVVVVVDDDDDDVVIGQLLLHRSWLDSVGSACIYPLIHGLSLIFPEIPSNIKFWKNLQLYNNSTLHDLSTLAKVILPNIVNTEY